MELAVLFSLLVQLFVGFSFGLILGMGCGIIVIALKNLFHKVNQK